jgi:hypothetical protein
MHSAPSVNPPPVPADLCGYSVERALTGDQSYLARDPGGRRVVLKRVDEDCLLGNQLHPSIKERLARVRELAHGGVANLHGVAREGESAWLIWEYVEGRTFDDYVADPGHTPLELLQLARELILAVDSLHSQGIVHGSLIGSNAIISPEGALRLIHVSPLLYTDMEVDVEGVVALLRDAVERRDERDSPLGRLISEEGRTQLSLRVLAASVAALLEARTGVGLPETRNEERDIRRRTFLAAAVVGIVGSALGYGIWRITAGGAEFRPARWMIPGPPAGK